LGNDNHYASCELDEGGNTLSVFSSDLFIIDIHTKDLFALKQADGFDGDQSYLPQGSRDEHLDFYPTVAPIATGGYFWLYFTSRRTYGNITPDSLYPVTERNSKKIWISAITIPTSGEFGGMSSDPSHPAFVLPGQEMEAGNMRAFPTLEPCKKEGDKCEVGFECCKGYCTNGICGPPETKCSKLDEACVTRNDCCDPNNECLGGFCALIILR
jgi:hypothetical protein